MTMDRFELQQLRDLPIEGVAERLPPGCKDYSDYYLKMKISR